MCPERRDERADLPQRLLTALSKVGQVLRSQSRSDLHGLGLTPTQAQILTSLAAAREEDKRLGDVARALGVSAPTASEAVAALLRRKLVRKAPDRDDRRAMTLELTPLGARAAGQAAVWSEPILAALRGFDPDELALLLEGLVRVLRAFEAASLLPTVRMCPTCDNFRRDVHAAPDRPHHCALLDIAIGGGDVRFDCAFHAKATSTAGQLSKP
jgi:DNA-binding MarR family transcriptional regulator